MYNKINKCINFKLKNIFVLLIPILIFLYLNFKNEINVKYKYIYISIISSTSNIIFLWNIPELVYILTFKPIYYEDLFLDESRNKIVNNININLKEKYEGLLTLILIIINSIFITILINYIFYKTNINLNYIEIFGIIGGILKIFQIGNGIITAITFHIFKIKLLKDSILLNDLEINSIKNIINLKRMNENNIKITPNNERMLIV